MFKMDSVAFGLKQMISSLQCIKKDRYYVILEKRTKKPTQQQKQTHQLAQATFTINDWIII